MIVNAEIIQACLADDRKAIKWLYEQCFHKFMPICYRYNKNDVCKVEIHSISKESYFFFIQALAQINNGGLFAQTPENIKTNIVTPIGAKTKAVGQFNMATVVSAKKSIK